MLEVRQTKNARSFSPSTWMWNWPETIVVDNRWQFFRSEAILVDTTHPLENEIYLVVSEHLILQTEEILDYSMTERKKEHKSFTFASSEQMLEESIVQSELLQENAEVITGLQNVQQGNFYLVRNFDDNNLLLEEGNKCFEMNKRRYTARRFRD